MEFGWEGAVFACAGGKALPDKRDVFRRENLCLQWPKATVNHQNNCCDDQGRNSTDQPSKRA